MAADSEIDLSNETIDLKDAFEMTLEIVKRTARNTCCMCCDPCLSCDAHSILKKLGIPLGVKK